jgi:hypothetical protein
MVRSASENSGNGGEAGDVKMSASSYALKILGSQDFDQVEDLERHVYNT